MDTLKIKISKRETSDDRLYCVLPPVILLVLSILNTNLRIFCLAGRTALFTISNIFIFCKIAVKLVEVLFVTYLALQVLAKILATILIQKKTSYRTILNHLTTLPASLFSCLYKEIF